jgi:hypothetical protein
LSLNDRVEALARELAQRENKHVEAIERAHYKAAELHRQVAAVIDRFNVVVGESVPYLEVAVSSPRVDDKHLHAVEFDLERGRHRAIVTVKAKGEVTLVGPFRSGKTEGPCRSFAFSAEEDLADALGDFLESFLEAAAAP